VVNSKELIGEIIINGVGYNPVVLAKPTNAMFLTNAKGILSGTVPRNALSIETCWAPELAVNVLI